MSRVNLRKDCKAMLDLMLDNYRDEYQTKFGIQLNEDILGLLFEYFGITNEEKPKHIYGALAIRKMRDVYRFKKSLDDSLGSNFDHFLVSSAIELIDDAFQYGIGSPDVREKYGLTGGYSKSFQPEILARDQEHLNKQVEVFFTESLMRTILNKWVQKQIGHEYEKEEEDEQDASLEDEFGVLETMHYHSSQHSDIDLSDMGDFRFCVQEAIKKASFPVDKGNVKIPKDVWECFQKNYLRWLDGDLSEEAFTQLLDRKIKSAFTGKLKNKTTQELLDTIRELFTEDLSKEDIIDALSEFVIESVTEKQILTAIKTIEEGLNTELQILRVLREAVMFEMAFFEDETTPAHRILRVLRENANKGIEQPDTVVNAFRDWQKEFNSMIGAEINQEISKKNDSMKLGYSGLKLGKAMRGFVYHIPKKEQARLKKKQEDEQQPSRVEIKKFPKH